MAVKTRERREQQYEDQVRVAETKLRGILKDRPGPQLGEDFAHEFADFAGEESPEDRSIKATLFGMQGSAAREARERINYLLVEEASITGLHQPEHYGPKMLACAEEVKGILEEAEPRSSDEEYVQAVIELLDEITTSLTNAFTSMLEI